MFLFFHFLVAAGNLMKVIENAYSKRTNSLAIKVHESRKKASKSDKSNVTWMFVPMRNLKLCSWWFLQSIPGWWIWYYWLCPLAWIVYGLITSQFGDITENTLVVAGQVGTTNLKAYIHENFGFQHSFLPVVGPMLLVWMALFAAVFIYAIKFLNFQHR